MSEHQTGEQSSEILVEHRSSQGLLLTAVRGSFLVSAVERLKESPHAERYMAALSPELRDQINFSLAMSWVSLDLLGEHCRVCDDLMLTDSELLELGGQTATSMSRQLLGTLLKTAGATPFTALSQLSRVYDRVLQGGAVSAFRVGPKDLQIEHLGNRLSASRYFRQTAYGFYRSLAELFSKKAYVKAARPRATSEHAFAMLISWV